MKKGIILTVLILICFLTGCFNTNGSVSLHNKKSLTSSSPIDVSNSTSQEKLLKTVSPAVVGISAISGRTQSIGTGVCIHANSYILTNNHVIENNGKITLYLFDGTTCSAQLLWRDSSMDLAILQSSKSIPYLEMANAGDYSTGEEVIAIGTPLALAFKHSATKGIISATNRTVAVENDTGESTLDNLIQHDASINPGNSGGPLINLKGQVVGINTVKVADAEGMGFAIPVDTIHPLVKNISANGFYETSYMGVFGYDANLKLYAKNRDGYYIQQVAENSPAQKLGLQKGDVIIKINGKKVDGTMSLKTLLYSFNAGEKVLIEFDRDGEIMFKELTLDRHPCCYRSQIIPVYTD